MWVVKMDGGNNGVLADWVQILLIFSGILSPFVTLILLFGDFGDIGFGFEVKLLVFSFPYGILRECIIDYRLQVFLRGEIFYSGKELSKKLLQRKFLATEIPVPGIRTMDIRKGDPKIDITDHICAKAIQICKANNESLHLYLLVPVMSREALKDMKFGGINVPQGFNIWIQVTALHNDPEI
ncbi:hypothetical protein LguiA_011855 [Lonicera macranthoides]